MRTRSALALMTCVGALTLLGVAPALAHPLGNATVNHYDGLELLPDRVLDHAVEDIAEIPTFQRKGSVDTDANGTLSEAERSAYASARCADMAATVKVTVNGDRVSFSVLSSTYATRPGQGGLFTGRLECELSGPANLDRAASVEVDSAWDDDGIGWHEITAIGKSVRLDNSPFPAATVSNELRKYPGDLLASPLDVRRGTVQTAPGSGSTYSAVRDLPVAGPVAKVLDRASREFTSVVGTERLTFGVGLLALLLSVALGAGHAFLPGHGKTIMAAYLVGKRGSLRDVVTVGATVTLTHTAGVLALGLLLTSTTAFAPASAERWLGVSSGLLIAGVGLFLLVGALRRRRSPVLRAPVLRAAVAQVPVSVGDVSAAGGVGIAPTHEHNPHADHDHDHDHAPNDADHDHDHGHDHGHDHAPHDHPHPHPHETEAAGHSHGWFGGKGHRHGPDGHAHGPAGDGFGRGGLIGLGVAGGLVPSPSALLVLLSAVALGRTWFGVGLVFGYGLGMALALSVAGLLLVRLRGRIDGWTSRRGFARAEKFAAVLPILTALLVLAVGTGLALRSGGGTV